MHKGLVKFILALFLFSVIYQGGYSAPVFPGNQQQYHKDVQIKASAHLLSSAKILSHSNLVAFTAYGKIKPLWTGNINVSGKFLSIICQTLFGQNRRPGIFCIQFFQRLLFPFHFFW